MNLREHLDSLRSLPQGERPALVVQGGGLRAVYSMGALVALSEEGLMDCFSVCVGSSAGAINLAYSLSGQSRDGLAIYTEDLTDSRFFAPWRLWRLVDIDFLVDVAMKCLHPLNLQALLNNAIPLLISLTNAEDGSGRFLSTHESPDQILEGLRATAALPTLYNRKVRVGDAFYVDGGIHQQVPVQEARDWGASEMLIITTRERGYRRNGHGRAYRLLGELSAVGQSRAIRRTIGAPDADYNRSMAMLETGGVFDGVKGWLVQPSRSSDLVGRTQNDRASLIRCAELGISDMRSRLEKDVNA